MGHTFGARCASELVGRHTVFRLRPFDDCVEQFGVLMGEDLTNLIWRFAGTGIDQTDAVVGKDAGDGFDFHFTPRQLQRERLGFGTRRR